MTKKRFYIIAIVLVVIVLAYIGFEIYLSNKVYTSIKVVSVIDEESDRDDSEYLEFASGLLKYNNEGISYIKNDETVWNQPYAMKNILIDVCGDYVAVGSKNSNEITLCSNDGFIANLKASYPVVSLEVSESGVVGTILKEEDVSYIEILDQESTKVVSIKTVLESNGYPIDMSMSDNAKKMAVSYVFFDSGIVSTKVVFYDFSDLKSSEKEKVSGGFNHYKSTIIPRLEFLDANTVCAFGDDMFTIYSVGEEPKITEETKLDSEIKSIFYSKDYFGMVMVNNDSDSSHVVKVYNKNGTEKASFEIDFAYTQIKFSGKNVLMYNDNSCEVYNFKGTKKFEYTFDEEINSMIGSGWNKYVLALKSSVKEIKLK